MKKILLLVPMLFLSFFSSFNISYASNDYENVLNNVSSNQAWDKITDNGKGVEWLLKSIANNIMMPIVIAIWILFAFIGFYKLIFSDKEDERKKWLNFVVYWVIWIVLMASTWFIINNLVWSAWTSWIMWSNTNFDPATIANNLYANIIKKFFTLAMYFVIGILFIILIINVIKFISSWDKEDVVKHSKTIIVWNSLWIIIIIFAQNIINMFYSKVSNWAISLWQQQGVLENKNLWWLYTVLNYFLGFVAFIITVFIIYQAMQLLLKPDDDATYKNLKKYFVYSIIWVLLIWWVYLIANFFIIK